MAKNRFEDLLDAVGVADTAGTAKGGAAKAGRRSDPRYRQISTYVRADLYKQVRRELLELERDFGDLLDELLGEWLSRRQAG